MIIINDAPVPVKRVTWCCTVLTAVPVMRVTW